MFFITEKVYLKKKGSKELQILTKNYKKLQNLRNANFQQFFFFIETQKFLTISTCNCHQIFIWLFSSAYLKLLKVFLVLFIYIWNLTVSIFLFRKMSIKKVRLSTILEILIHWSSFIFFNHIIHSSVIIIFINKRLNW